MVGRWSLDRVAQPGRCMADCEVELRGERLNGWMRKARMLTDTNAERVNELFEQ
jgi:hypothetical protein